MAIAGMTAAIYATDLAKAAIPFVDKPTITDEGTKRYQIADTTLRYWDLQVPVIVKVDGDKVGDEEYILEHAGGYVVFHESQEESVVTVSGSAITLSQVGGAFNWSVDAEADDADTTNFDSGNWKTFARVLLGWSGSVEAYWGDLRFFNSVGKIIVMKFFIGKGASLRHLEGYAIIMNEGIETNVANIIGDTLDFTGVGPLFFRES